MKRILLIVCFFFNISIYPQFAAEDADKIYTSLIVRSNSDWTFKDDPTSVTLLCGILRNYMSQTQRNNTDLKESEVLAEFKQTPFFGEKIGDLIKSRTAKKPSDINALFTNEKAFGFPNIDVTNFADGLAKFLVARTKEELNVAFFRKFKDFIDQYPEAKVLFPTTYTFIGQIHSQHYTAMLPALKTAFNKDFSAFNSNLLKLRDLTCDNCNYAVSCKGVIGASEDKTDQCQQYDKCKGRMDNLKTFLSKPEGRVVVACLLISENLTAGNNAAEIIANVANDLTIDQDDNFSYMLHFVNLISHSLRSLEQGKIWIDSNQVKDLVTNEFELKLYLGLLSESDKNLVVNRKSVKFIIDSKLVTLNEIFKALDDNWDSSSAKFKVQFKKLADAAAVVSNKTADLNKSAEDGIEGYIIQYSQYVNTFSNFLKVSVSFIESNPQLNTALKTDLTKLKNDLNKFVEIIDASTGIAYDIKSKNYSALVLDSSILLAALLDKDFTYRESFTRYATFMANVTEAKDSDEVNRAIEAAVMPVGSSSVKRESDMNIAVNAYLGVFAGYEKMPALATNTAAGSAGLLAPVGVAFTWGNHKCEESKRTNVGGKSWTFFLSVIDVGALASYRFSESQTNVASEITLENIVSPGGFFYFGFGKCPISVGAGIQFSPQLREITDAAEATITQTKNLSIRYGLSVVVDIPLFNLYTKTN